MNYIILDNNAKESITFGEGVSKDTVLDFTDAKFMGMKIEGKNIIIKISNPALEKNLYTFELKNATILNFEMDRCEGKCDDKFNIGSIEISEQENGLFVIICINNGSDYRFQCADLQLISVEHFVKTCPKK